ncbi:MAG: hypothetical protein GVY35_17330 [Bacteroidetes bacterium]|nr:hypothetical protein [Bacteroidota bacterium]
MTDGPPSKEGGNATGQDARQGRGRQQHRRGGTRAAQAPRPGATSSSAPAAHSASDGPKPLASLDAAAADPKPSPDRSFDAKILQVTSDGATNTASTKKTAGGTGAAPFMDRARTLAWLRSTGRSTVYKGGNDGWKTLEMQLKNGDGLMTVRTRQRKDQMAVSVGFSDARLRAQVAASLHQLQEMLQSQYDAPVDFSLMGDGTNNAHQHAASDDARNADSSGPSAPGANAPREEEPAPRRALAPGTKHEWIG